ncbi:MAG: dynamin family protein [Cyanobacteria bacterium P01_C01_bin.69]
MIAAVNNPTDFFSDLDRVAEVRRQMADELETMIRITAQSEEIGAEQSGQMGLSQTIEDMEAASRNLRQGVFRLLVLGDMKRGKSTFLNALIGENLLPSDVNPCTALLTILRYGPEKKITVHFLDNTAPEDLDFDTFKQRYTIDPSEAKQLEAKDELAFPNVSHAVAEYPLPLLEKGIEIVDSPGLNDTEARNELSLGYINNCHAILFMLRATQPCTLAERRYLETYLQGRGLSVFFLINAWDQIKESLIDPDDEIEVADAEAKLHRLFRTHLQDYCQVDGIDCYSDRVFAVSALEALRQRLKDPNTSLEDTNLGAFVQSLNIFLTQERAIAELRQARTLGRETRDRFTETVARRIPLLSQGVDELKTRINSVRPEFEALSNIQSQFQGEIHSVRDRQAQTTANSLKTYIYQLEDTFEADFLRYQPELGLSEFLSGQGRTEFSIKLRKAFERYVNDKFQTWAKAAEKEIDGAFESLSKSASDYGSSYQAVTERMTEKLTGQAKINGLPTGNKDESSPSWVKWAMGLLSLASNNPAGVVMAATGFDWQSILANFLVTSTVVLIGGTLFGAIFGPVGILLAGFGVGAFQLDHARKELAKAMKKELVKHLPKLANEQWQPVYDGVQACFDRYEEEVMGRIEQDICDRKAELANLVSQKESREIDRDAEVARLEKAETDIQAASSRIDDAYQHVLMQT